MKLKCLFVFVFMIINTLSEAQIAGISGTKLAAFSVDQIAIGNIEFEPTYTYGRSSAYWDEFELKQSDSIQVSSSITWRLTYGVTDKLEFGLQTTSDVSFSNLAIKYHIYDINKLQLSLMYGLGIPMGNNTIAKNNRQVSDVVNYGLGLISTFYFTERTSFDFNIQYQNYFRAIPNQTQRSYFINTDFGHYLPSNKYLLMLGMGYQNSGIDENKQAGFNLFPGFAIESAEDYVLVFSGSKTFFGYNTQDVWSASITLTLLLD